jgi:endonuclease III related protein
LRQELLAVSGIGPETADSMLLYALEKPVFVVDAYTHRVLQRHGLAADESSYDDLQSLFHEGFDSDSQYFNEYHALIVAVGKQYCRPRSPKCGSCPLQGLNWPEGVVSC